MVILVMFPQRKLGAFIGEFVVTKNTGDLRFEINIGIGVTTVSSVDTGYISQLLILTCL